MTRQLSPLLQRLHETRESYVYMLRTCSAAAIDQLVKSFFLTFPTATQLRLGFSRYTSLGVSENITHVWARAEFNNGVVYDEEHFEQPGATDEYLVSKAIEEAVPRRDMYVLELTQHLLDESLDVLTTLYKDLESITFYADGRAPDKVAEPPYVHVHANWEPST